MRIWKKKTLVFRQSKNIFYILSFLLRYNLLRRDQVIKKKQEYVLILKRNFYKVTYKKLLCTNIHEYEK